MRGSSKRTAGWREWVGLPGLGVERIKAKLDTGARTSAIHAFGVESFMQAGERWVRFRIHPLQRDDATEIECAARVADIRTVANPGGRRQKRYIICTELTFGGESWPIELSLTDRDEMGFRMLIGRTAMHGRLVVDPDASYRLGRPKRAPRPKIPKEGTR